MKHGLNSFNGEVVCIMGIDTGCKDRYTMNFTKQQQTLLRRVMRELGRRGEPANLPPAAMCRLYGKLHENK
jgi:hypothetical protein